MWNAVLDFIMYSLPLVVYEMVFTNAPFDLYISIVLAPSLVIVPVPTTLNLMVIMPLPDASIEALYPESHALALASAAKACTGALIKNTITSITEIDLSSLLLIVYLFSLALVKRGYHFQGFITRWDAGYCTFNIIRKPGDKVIIHI